MGILSHFQSFQLGIIPCWTMDSISITSAETIDDPHLETVDYRNSSPPPPPPQLQPPSRVLHPLEGVFRRHLSNEQWPCSVCNQDFTQYRDLYLHMEAGDHLNLEPQTRELKELYVKIQTVSSMTKNKFWSSKRRKSDTFEKENDGLCENEAVPKSTTKSVNKEAAPSSPKKPKKDELTTVRSLPFNCHLCNKEAETEDLLNAHLLVVHSADLASLEAATQKEEGEEVKVDHLGKDLETKKTSDPLLTLPSLPSKSPAKAVSAHQPSPTFLTVAVDCYVCKSEMLDTVEALNEHLAREHDQKRARCLVQGCGASFEEW